MMTGADVLLLVLSSALGGAAAFLVMDALKYSKHRRRAAWAFALALSALVLFASAAN